MLAVVATARRFPLAMMSSAAACGVRGKSSVAVVGGAGQLGRAVVDAFAAADWTTVSVDVAANPQAATSVTLSPEASLSEVCDESLAKVRDSAGAEGKFDAIVCVAGGWEGDGEGGPASDTFVASTESMFRMNLWSAVNSAHLAARLLKSGGMVTFTGAVGALGPSPGMLGYGMAKAATHHLVKSLAFEDGLVAGFAGVAFPCHINAILPGVLDTATNRAGMPDADFAAWTPLEAVSEQLVQWAADASRRPANGALVEVCTEAGATSFREL